MIRKRRILLAAGSEALFIVDVGRRRRIRDLPVPGRTRWTVFDGESATFFVNVGSPSQILANEANDPTRIARVLDVPAKGPHGLDLDQATRRLFCAADSKTLVAFDMGTGQARVAQDELSGPPDVILCNSALRRLYVAIGEPGVVDVFDIDTLEKVESVPTEADAHTLAFDAMTNKIYVFYPASHRPRSMTEGGFL